MSELPVTYNLKAYRGDTWSQTFRLIYEGVPVDLSTATVACWAGIHDLTYPLPVTVADQVASPGEVTITMPTPSLAVGAYSYDLEVIEQDGTVTTWVRGRLAIEQDVTNAA
jgi:hypothetical protein